MPKSLPIMVGMHAEVWSQLDNSQPKQDHRLVFNDIETSSSHFLTWVFVAVLIVLIIITKCVCYDEILLK